MLAAKNLNLWVSYICGQSVPVFRHTTQSILSLIHSQHSTSKQLADTILQDTAFTARVLRIANSSYYNRTKTTITNIRQAVLLIGFNKILAISITVSIVDALVTKTTLQRINQLTRQSIATAMLATSLAKRHCLPHREDIYLAALLYEFGELTFWSLSGNAGEEIAAQLEASTLVPTDAQQELLGITFKELTQGLTTQWHLSELLHLALLRPNSQDPRIQCIVHAHRLVKAESQYEHEYQLALAHLADWLNIPQEYSKTLIKHRLDEARDIITQYLAHE